MAESKKKVLIKAKWDLKFDAGKKVSSDVKTALVIDSDDEKIDLNCARRLAKKIIARN